MGVSQFTLVELEGHKPYFTNHGLTLIDTDLGPLSWLCLVIALSVYIRVHLWFVFLYIHAWLKFDGHEAYLRLFLEELVRNSNQEERQLSVDSFQFSVEHKNR